MSGCPRFDPDLVAYLDDELAAEARGALEAHLPDCDACRAAVQAQSALGARLAALPAVDLSPRFEAEFWARLARSAESQHRRSSWLQLPRFALAGAAVAVLLWAIAPGDPALPEQDWQIIAEAERFELLLIDDHELLLTLEVLEAWDGSEEG